MKKLILVSVMMTVLLFGATAFAQDFGGAIKAGVDFAGKWTIESGPGEVDTATSASIALEGYYLINQYVDLGLGVQYLIERELEAPATPGLRFWFIPIYAVVRVHPAMTDFTPYGIVQVGYGFHGGNAAYEAGGDLNGGFYWGAGGGVIFMRHFIGEVLFSQARGIIDPAGPGDFEVTHSRVTFSVGYNF